jgi:hypothetical protein
LFNAWRVYFIDRMMREYDNEGWADKRIDPISELDYDIEYYNGLVEKEKAKKK